MDNVKEIHFYSTELALIDSSDIRIADNTLQLSFNPSMELNIVMCGIYVEL